MPKKISTLVLESEKELQLLLNKTTTDRIRGRLKTLLLLKKGTLCYQSELAKKLGFNEKTIREWLKLYEKEGLSSFLKIRVGGNRKSVLTQEIIVFIKEHLGNPETTITSYVELQQLIYDTFDQDVNYKTLYNYCTRVFKSKLKVSRKSHYQKNEQAIEVFKKTTQYIN